MSATDLISHLQPSTVEQLYSTAKMFAEKPQLVMKWHVCVSSPSIGQQSYSFDDFDSMRRELTRVSGKLTMGSIHIFYGYEMPVSTDASGFNLFTVDKDGREVSLTEGYNTRTRVNKGIFGTITETVNIDEIY